MSRRATIGIVGGTGREGRGLAVRWARAGHDVCVGSRDAARGREKASELSAEAGLVIRGGDNVVAASSAEVVVLTVPYAAHAETLVSIREAARGRLVIDLTVPLKPPRVRIVHLPEGVAAALEAQAALGAETRVVATLHHVSSAHLADPEHAVDCDVLVCADDDAARERAIDLIGDLGLRAFDAGPLRNAVALEALTPVLLHLNKRYGGEGAGIRITGIPTA